MMDLLRLFRVFNEMIFVVIGALLLWVALAGRYFFDPRQPSWLILAGVLIVWGIYTWLRARRVTPPRTRLAMRIGGGSVALVGSHHGVAGLGAIRWRLVCCWERPGAFSFFEGW